MFERRLREAYIFDDSFEMTKKDLMDLVELTKKAMSATKKEENG